MDSKKTNDKRKYFKPADMIVLGVVLLVAVLGILRLLRSEDSSLAAVITVDSKTYCKINLSDVTEPYNLYVPTGDGQNVVVHITSTSAEILSSPCKDKLCVNTGKLTKSSQAAVCLPERVSVKLVASSQSNENLPDAVVG